MKIIFNTKGTALFFLFSKMQMKSCNSVYLIFVEFWSKTRCSIVKLIYAIFFCNLEKVQGGPETPCGSIIGYIWYILIFECEQWSRNQNKYII